VEGEEVELLDVVAMESHPQVLEPKGDELLPGGEVGR